MKRRKSFSTNQGTEEPNISPLIDMVFILLIFFIVTTVFVEETGVEVNKPEAASAVDLEKNSILIAVTENGNVVYGGRNVGLSGVRSVVRRNLENDDIPVIVQGDRNTSHGLVMQVVDEAKLAGAKKISFATEN